MSNITEKNTTADKNFITVRNTAAISTDIDAGTILLDKYTVKKRLEVTSGEATVFVCEYCGKEFVAKVYNRPDAIKAEIVEKLQSLNSPYVAKFYDVGTFNENTVVILPYYKLGSLQGKKISFSSLKKNIIPCLNEALKTLHDAGILHKDLKPANIMFLENRAGVALIDFGISSVISNASVVVTKSGLTFAYASPEALYNAYLEESDYYSLGITIYELFCGNLPYENLTPEEIARYTAIQKLPYPDDMPQELQNLISGLTYSDLTNRADKENPNRRWTYEEVKNWLEDKPQPIPGGKIFGTSAGNFLSGYKFDGKNYNNVDNLVMALAENWAEGKKHFTRGLISAFFKSQDQEIASYCMDAEEEVQRGRNSDVEFWKLLYKLSPNLKKFFWKNKNYSSAQKFGEDILIKLRMADTGDKKFWNEILENNLLSQYLKNISAPKAIIDAVKSLENTNKDRANNQKYYQLAYLLTGSREFVIDGKNFSTVEELINHMNNLLKNSADTFENFCYKLIDGDNNLNEEFEAWLIAIGKRAELNKWKNNLR